MQAHIYESIINGTQQQQQILKKNLITATKKFNCGKFTAQIAQMRAEDVLQCRSYIHLCDWLYSCIDVCMH